MSNKISESESESIGFSLLFNYYCIYVFLIHVRLCLNKYVISILSYILPECPILSYTINNVLV